MYSRLRPASRLALGVALLLCWSSSLVAQFTAQVRFANRTPAPRKEWGEAVVPFPQGVWTPGASFAVVGLPGELKPFGAMWPDGSVRFARLTTRLNLAAGAKQSITVQQNAVPPSTPFVFPPWVQAALGNFDFIVAVSANGGLQLVGLNSPGVTGSILDNTTSRISLHYRGAVPNTDLWFEAWITFFNDQDHARFELRITNSDTDTQQVNDPNPNIWRQDVDYVALLANHAMLHVRGDTRLGVGYTPPTPTGLNAATLLGQTHFFDGQAHEWTGEILFYDPDIAVPDAQVRLDAMTAALAEPFYGVAQNWQSSGAFGPFGVIPAPPSWISPTGETEGLQKRTAFRAWLASAGAPWEDRPYGVTKTPGQSGSQYDFGAVNFVDVFWSGLPDRVEEIRYNAGEEAQRPVHFLDSSGLILQSANHPNWVTWNGRTHDNLAVSPDRLNKPFPPASLNSHGWHGRDWQHYSVNTLAAAYLLTASPSLLREFEHRVQLYLAGRTLPSTHPGWSTNGIGASRGVGRTYHAMSWTYLCTGDAALKQRMVDRLSQCLVPQWIGGTVTGPVKPIVKSGPDCRQMQHDHWRPWEESQAVLGLEACYATIQAANARAVAQVVAKTSAIYGWHPSVTPLQIAYPVRWKANGAALTNAEYLSTPCGGACPINCWVGWSTSFNEWSMPAIIMALRFGVVNNDPPLVQRAQQILTAIQAGRTQPPGGGWDRFADWEAVQ